MMMIVMLLVTNLGTWQSKLDLTWCHLKQNITQILRDISQKTRLPTYSDTHAHLICVTFMFICPFSSRRDQTWYLVIICFCLLSTRDSSTVACSTPDWYLMMMMVEIQSSFYIQIYAKTFAILQSYQGSRQAISRTFNCE